MEEGEGGRPVVFERSCEWFIKSNNFRYKIDTIVRMKLMRSFEGGAHYCLDHLVSQVLAWEG